MPNHSPDHMRRITSASAATRRAAKIARLIATCPPLTDVKAAELQALLAERATPSGGAR